MVRAWRQFSEDGIVEWIAVDDRYPSCSWISDTMEDALYGLAKLTIEIEKDMA